MCWYCPVRTLCNNKHTYLLAHKVGFVCQTHKTSQYQHDIPIHHVESHLVMRKILLYCKFGSCDACTALLDPIRCLDLNFKYSWIVWQLLDFLHCCRPSSARFVFSLVARLQRFVFFYSSFPGCPSPHHPSIPRIYPLRKPSLAEAYQRHTSAGGPPC